MKKALINLAIYGRVGLSYFAHTVSFLIPKNKKVWIFIGWRRTKEREIFAENTKYFFLYAHHRLDSIRPIWIGMDKKICAILMSQGYEAYPIHSVKGLYYSLRGSHTFISGLLQLANWRLIGGSKLIQLWHGKSLKKTGHNSPYGLTRYNKILNPHLFVPVHKFVAVSEFLSDFIVSDFHIPKGDILITGIPKYDALLTHIAGSEIDLDQTLNILIEEIRTTNPRRLFFYGPTFRPDGSNPLLSLDLQALNDRLALQNDAMIISLHPKFSAKDWIPEGVKLTHVYFSQGDMDKYPIMHKFDVLVTDYSSLAIDFLYMNKPVILFAYDLHTFTKEMGVYEELWSLMPGPKVFTFEELLNALDFDENMYASATQTAREKLFTYTDTDASKRIATALAKST